MKNSRVNELLKIHAIKTCLTIKLRIFLSYNNFLFIVTNYITEATTISFQDSSTGDLTSVSEKYLEMTDPDSTTNENLSSSSVNIDSSTFTIEIEGKIAVENVTNEYPGAINEGHLFSIIRNGKKI